MVDELFQVREYIRYHARVQVRYLLMNTQDALKKCFCLLVIPLLYGEASQVIEKKRDIGMLWSERLLTNSQRLPIKGFSLLIVPLQPHDTRQTIEAMGRL